jgi:RES domain-containing protein
VGGRATWYGSSSQAGAWAELFRHTLDPVAAAETRRRIGHAEFNVLALDLTDDRIRAALGLKPSDLTSDDLEVCQTLADLAADAGFSAVIGPSAALKGGWTLAVLDRAVGQSATSVTDLGVRVASSATDR